ncbi:MAG: TonB C-terminal domain-containing protein [Bdellovibrio sp.]|nr:TonB C-terminal domain-containing protein [Bdellovibrio sp.]
MAAEKLPIENLDKEIREKKFKQGIMISVIAHVLLVITFTVKTNLFKKPPIDITQAIRVDMIGLPDKVTSNQLPAKVQEVLKEKEPPKPVEEPTPEPKNEKPVPVEKKDKVVLPKKELPKPKVDTEAINLKKVKATQKNALEKLKAQSAIEKIKEDMQKEEARKNAVAAVMKGRVISAGTSLTGLDKIQSDAYLQTLDAHIKQYWTLPQWLINKPYKARVLVKFDSTGKILSKQIESSSGVKAYDDYCLQSITQAEPFPKFSEKFSEKYKSDGVLIGFPE